MRFDELAGSWDTEERRKRAKIVAEEIRKSVPFSKESTAMEFGCGTGLVSFNLYEHLKSITLIDSSKNMVEVVNYKIEQFNTSNLKSFNLDIMAQDSLKEKYDLIYSSMALHHIKDIKAISEKFYSMINPEGHLCIVDLNEEDGSFHKNEIGFDGHNGFNQQQLKVLLEECGFSEVEAHTFYYDNKKIDEELIDYSLFLIKGKKSVR
ncbi:class I SAM-dependent methyltransferase [Clostridium sp. C8-1-8]|uniref:class I SAM-dependent DNA methyltransferase n=1 Tax=Clostridium sp. C8-1-8 TaxID=2698831 RepID=UPI0013709FA7|nr:class I SAM-dependent methyltransferase [Clostridium sp. C8-1-8]